MKKNRKMKWVVVVLTATIAVIGAASLTAFGTDHQTKTASVQSQKMQSFCSIDQNCFKKGVHHTERTSSAAQTPVTSTAGTGTASTAGSCQYPDCDGTHSNHQTGSYGHHYESSGHHGYSHSSGHHGGHHQ